MAKLYQKFLKSVLGPKDPLSIAYYSQLLPRLKMSSDLVLPQLFLNFSGNFTIEVQTQLENM